MWAPPSGSRKCLLLLTAHHSRCTRQHAHMRHTVQQRYGCSTTCSQEAHLSPCTVIPALSYFVPMRACTLLLLLLAVVSLVSLSGVSALTCPDGGVCPSQSTCCPSSSGGYNCCLQYRGVCCSDMVCKHCRVHGCIGGNKCMRE